MPTQRHCIAQALCAPVGSQKFLFWLQEVVNSIGEVFGMLLFVSCAWAVQFRDMRL